MNARDLIRKFEGCRLDAYPDPATGGAPWTIGYGCTGPGIHPGLTITQEQADEMLEHRLPSFETAVRSLVHVPLTPGQLAALISFEWNTGHLHGSTLLAKLNAGDIQGAADEFPKWVHAAGKVLPGLVARRAEERAVFLGEEV